MNQGPIVELAQGGFGGIVDGGVNIFRAIPYAKAERFGPPQAPLSHVGMRDASRPGVIPPQLPSRLEIVMGPTYDATQSEDCQQISVFTPNLQGKRPVMVWFHGGANVSGGGELPWYDGTKLAAEQDVVVVTVSHRLGALGYLYMPERGVMNLGLQDQIAALRWVKTNVSRFGGDPDAIVAFGQSAGAHSVLAILEHEPNLVQRAIIQSAPAGIRLTAGQASEVRQLLEVELGCGFDQASVENILKAQEKVMARSKLPFPFSPVMGDRAITTDLPGIDLLIGYTRNEAAPFVHLEFQKRGLRAPHVVSRMLGAVLGRKVIGRPSADVFANSKAEGRNAFLYRIDWAPRGASFGATHCVELPLLLGDQAAWARAPMLGQEKWDDIDRLGRDFRAAWVNFARTGQRPRENAALKIVG